MANFHLQIVTPDRLVFDGEAERIVLRTVQGDVCILARHIDYAAPLGTGEASVGLEDGSVRTAACSGGLLSVAGGEVRVMATTFEWAEEIDLERAQNAQIAAEKKLAELKHGDTAYAVTEAKLKRAVTRINVKG